MFAYIGDLPNICPLNMHGLVIMASRRDITGMMARCRGIIPKWPDFSAIFYVMFQVDELLQFGQIISIISIISQLHTDYIFMYKNIANNHLSISMVSSVSFCIIYTLTIY